MAIFETDGSTEIHITPKQYYEACKTTEQVQMCDIIMDDFDLVYESDVEKAAERSTPRSQSQRVFNNSLMVLEENWMSITKKDEEKILKIAKKYGIG